MNNDGLKKKISSTTKDLKKKGYLKEIEKGVLLWKNIKAKLFIF